jgi:hypothetical protein
LQRELERRTRRAATGLAVAVTAARTANITATIAIAIAIAITVTASVKASITAPATTTAALASIPRPARLLDRGPRALHPRRLATRRAPGDHAHRRPRKGDLALPETAEPAIRHAEELAPWPDGGPAGVRGLRRAGHEVERVSEGAAEFRGLPGPHRRREVVEALHRRLPGEVVERAHDEGLPGDGTPAIARLGDYALLLLAEKIEREPRPGDRARQQRPGPAEPAGGEGAVLRVLRPGLEPTPGVPA